VIFPPPDPWSNRRPNGRFAVSGKRCSEITGGYSPSSIGISIARSRLSESRCAMRNAGFADAAVSSRERTRLPCPLTRAPIARAIILNDRQSSSAFLDAAARLCDDCGIRPIVLTVAKTEDEAGSRQRIAETVLQKLEAVADFDYVVGNDS